MKITHLGHACLLLEYADAHILIDPGTFSTGFEELTDLDAILVTHQHPDHIDAERVPALMRANPGARLIVEPEVITSVMQPRDSPMSALSVSALAAGEAMNVGTVTVTAGGGRHAVIHEDLPQVGNVGLVLRSEGEPSVFHPGDSLDLIPSGIDLLAVPLSAPWCAVKETITFVREVGAPQAMTIHDQVVSEKARSIYTSHIQHLGGVELRDLSTGDSLTL